MTSRARGGSSSWASVNEVDFRDDIKVSPILLHVLHEFRNDDAV